MYGCVQSSAGVFMMGDAEVTDDLVGNSDFDQSNNTNGNFCLEWSAEELESWKITTICISSAGVLACILAIICILVSKGYKKFVHRLTLYLVIVVKFIGVLSILRVVPVYHNGTVVAMMKDLEVLCAVAGFLDTVADWMELLIIFWIMVYLAMVLVFKYSANAVRRKHEVCGVAVILVFPFLFNWVPFLKDMYGLSGGECWIKPSVKSYCEYDGLGLTFMFVLSYCPVFIVCLITFVSFGTLVIVMCKRALQQEQGLHQSSIHWQGIKEVLPLLLYPLIYFLLWMAVTATRIYDVLQKGKGRNFQFSLILAHYVTFLVVTLLVIPLVVLVHSSIKCYRKKQGGLYTPTATTSYIVSNELSDQEGEPLIIKGQVTKIPSKGYNSILEGSAKV